MVFLALFRADIPSHFRRPDQGTPDPGRRFLAVATILLAAIVVALLLAGFLGWPLYVVALAGAFVLAAVGLLSRQVGAATIWKGIAWQLPLFVVGMYIVVLGVNRAVLAPLWSSLLGLSAGHPSIGVVFLAFATGVGANLVNNIPMSLVAITALHAVPASRDLLAFATVIGTNLGPNVTVFGSLATMLVLTTARQRGIQITSGQYLKVGLLTTPPMIAVASLLLLTRAAA